MADINVERKGPSIWPWIIGLIVLAVLIWLLTEMFDSDDEVETEPALEEPVMVEPAPEPAAPTAMVAALPVAEIVDDPVTFEGRTVSGEATVAETVDGRTFWLEDQGRRMLVVLHTESALSLEAGQRVRITDARVVGAGELAPGSAAAEEQDVVLSVGAANIELMNDALADTAGTGRAPL